MSWGGATSAGTVTDNGTVKLDGITLTPTSLTVAAGAHLNGSGTVAAAVTNGGTIETTAGSLKVSGAVTGTGTLLIDAGNTLELGSSAATTQTAVFASSTGTLNLDTPGSFAGSISGFSGSDDIHLGGQVATGLSYNATTHKLTVSGSGGTIATLTFNGTYVQSNFVLANGGKDITDPPVPVAHDMVGASPAPMFITAFAGSSLLNGGVLDFGAALQGAAESGDLSQVGSHLVAEQSGGGTNQIVDLICHGHSATAAALDGGHSSLSSLWADHATHLM